MKSRRKSPSRSPPRRRGYSPPRRWTNGSSSSSSSSSFGSTSVSHRGQTRGRTRGYRGSGDRNWNRSPRFKSTRGGRGRGRFNGDFRYSRHSPPRRRDSSSPPKSAEFTIVKVSGIRRNLSGDAVKDAVRRIFRSYDYKISVADEGRDQSAYLFFDSATQAEAAAASHTHVRLEDDDPDEVHVDIVPRSQAPSPGFSSGVRFERGARNGYQESNSKPHFPDYLTHVQPEDDPLACRTLFVGNLGVNVTGDELEDIFSTFGKIKDVDIKRPRLGEGNAFAFLRYENLEMAHRAKTEMSGQYVGKYICKIGYGKQVPTPKVWIGGLSESWASQEMIHDEFDRFGAIRELTRSPGGKCAHVEFDTVDAAIAAVERMRGYPLGGPEKRIRVDFVDLDAVFHAENGHTHSTRKRRLSRGSSLSPPRRNGKLSSSPRSPVSEPPELARPQTPPTPTHHLPSLDETQSAEALLSSLEQIPLALSLTDAAQRNPTSWRGAVILKASVFATQMHCLEGDEKLLSLFASDGQRTLRVGQRLRLDQARLKDIEKSLANRPSYAVYLALPTSTTGLASVSEAGQQVQVRPFRSLVVYLKSKSAAGIVAYKAAENEEKSTGDAISGLVYIFPPCEFSAGLLAKQNPPIDSAEDDHVHKDNYLVVVAIADCRSE